MVATLVRPEAPEVFRLPKYVLPHPELVPQPGRTCLERYCTTPEGALAFGSTGVLVRDHQFGHYFKSREHLLLHNQRHEDSRQKRILAFLRDHVDRRIPNLYYKAVLGHPLHISTYASLHVQHFHASLYDPFTGKLGFWEDVGQVSDQKVTTAFRDFEVDQLQSSTSAYGSFKYHEVGTDATAEANSQTALIVSTGIARVAGTQTEVAADQYRSVATVTADTTETWQEHGLFNASSGVTLMDRSLISPTVAVVNLDTVQFTYTLTKNAEA